MATSRKRASSKRVVIIDGHPDPDEARYVHALTGAYARGARQAGHSVELFRLSSMNFPLLRSNADFYGGVVPPEIKRIQEAIICCDHIVMIYPLWLGNMPALLKGLLEQVFRRAVAYADVARRGASQNPLKGKSARIVITMAMPAPFYRQHLGAHSLRNMRRNAAGFLGIAPIRSQVIGRVEALTPAQRRKLLETMHEHGRNAR